MGGHFDAVGFGDPELGFEATREYLRATVSEGKLVARAGGILYYELETSEGCGLTAITDDAGFLMNGCPYFRGEQQQQLRVTKLAPWEPAEPALGGARAEFLDAAGKPVCEVSVALPRFAAESASRRAGTYQLNVVGLGYYAITHANDRSLPPDLRPQIYFRPTSVGGDLPPLRRCNVDCRGRIERASLLVNARSGARLAYALLNCGELTLEIVIDLPSLSGGLAIGAFLEGSFWLVGRFLDEKVSADLA